MEKQLPKNWVETKFANLISFVIGGDWGYDSEEVIEDSSLVYCIRGSEIRDWNKNKGNTAALRRLKNTSIEKRKLNKGDILIEISGGGPDQPVGRTIYIDEESIKNKSFLPIVCTNFFRQVRIYKSTDSKYINYHLHYFYIIGNTIELQGGSNNLRNLKFKEYQQITIPLPPLAEQKRIAEKLDALFGQLDSVRGAMSRIPTLLANLRQQILTHAVTGKLTQEWRQGKNLEGWKPERADECCIKVQSGGTPKGGDFSTVGIPFLKVYNIVQNKIDFEYQPQYVTNEIQNTQIKKSITYPGDVIMNIVGPPLNKIAIIPSTHPEWNLNQAITLFRTKDYLMKEYLYYFFCEGSSVNSLINETRGVVGQVNISLSQCRAFIINIPPKSEQEEIVNRVQSLSEKLDSIEQRYQMLKTKLENLPQAILHKAFKGELVEQLPTDGNATDLLREIEQLKKSLKKK